MNKKQILCWLLPALMLTSELTHAEIYKWVDEDGHTHFSQQAPEQVKDTAEVLDIKPQLTPKVANTDNTAAVLERNRRWFNQQEIRRREEQNASQQAKTDPYQRGRSESLKTSQAYNCQWFKNQYQRYKSELKTKKKAGMSVRAESWYKTKIASQKDLMKERC